MVGSDGPVVVSPQPTPPPFVSDPNAGLDVRTMASTASSYAITYGALDTNAINILKTYPLVIVHPYNGNITADQIKQIKQGINPVDPSDNAVVLCYVSIGEDSRTYGLTDAEMLADARFRYDGSGSGPSRDPRSAGVTSLVMSPDKIKGIPTNGGFATYYLNDNAVRCKGAPDGKPDRNPNFETRFVNAGDPEWYRVVDSMLMDPASHTPPGLKEMLTTSYGRGLSCDGVFLDTIDTAAPNSYSGGLCSDTLNSTNSEWTAQGFTEFIKRVRGEYQDKVILQNRGLFYFDPRLPHFEVSARGIIDIGFFESYYLDNNSDSVISPYFLDNKYNVATKLMAEANRPGTDGFKVLSLGYANGFNDNPKPGIDIKTLLGGVTGLGYATLITDMQEARAVGFYPYITSASVSFLNSFVKNYPAPMDLTPPHWSSVYNAGATATPPLPPVARVGVQKAVKSSSASVTVSWDVALDMNKVSYVLYYQTEPLPFKFTTATRLPLSPVMGEGYTAVWNTFSPNEALRNVYPFQQTITGLQPGKTYNFVIRAIDAVGNEDNNTISIEVSL